MKLLEILSNFKKDQRIEKITKKLVLMLTGYEYPYKNEQDKDGNTVLHICAKEGDLQSLKCLMIAATDFDIKNKQGLTAIEVASNDEVRQYLLDSEIIDAITYKKYEKVLDLIFRRKVDLNKSVEITYWSAFSKRLSFVKVTPLYTAAYNGNPGLVVLIRSLGGVKTPERTEIVLKENQHEFERSGYSDIIFDKHRTKTRRTFHGPYFSDIIKILQWLNMDRSSKIRAMNDFQKKQLLSMLVAMDFRGVNNFFDSMSHHQESEPKLKSTDTVSLDWSARQNTISVKEFIQAAENGDIAVMQRYLDNGGDISATLSRPITTSSNEKCYETVTAITAACALGKLAQTKVVEFLINKDAKGDEAASPEGATPLFLAILGARLDIVKMFTPFSISVDYDFKDNKGDRAIDVAYKKCRNAETCEFDSIEILKHLVRKTAEQRAGLNGYSSRAYGDYLDPKYAQFFKYDGFKETLEFVGWGNEKAPATNSNAESSSFWNESSARVVKSNEQRKKDLMSILSECMKSGNVDHLEDLISIRALINSGKLDEAAKKLAVYNKQQSVQKK